MTVTITALYGSINVIYSLDLDIGLIEWQERTATFDFRKPENQYDELDLDVDILFQCTASKSRILQVQHKL